MKTKRSIILGWTWLLAAGLTVAQNAVAQQASAKQASAKPAKRKRPGHER